MHIIRKPFHSRDYVVTIALGDDYLKNFSNIILESVDLYNYKGDYIESQAFGYLAIRSYLSLPITFPKTTGCKAPTTGGFIVKNF